MWDKALLILFAMFVLGAATRVNAASRVHTHRCEEILSSLETSWYSKVQNYFFGLKYLEDSNAIDTQNEFRLIDELLKNIRIGYDNDYTSTIPERRWNGMWTKFKGNVWDIKYSDPPNLYDLETLVSESPEEKGFRLFARKAIHFKGGPEPIAYLIGWEQLFTRHVDWAVHIVFVSGGDYWIFGKNVGGRRQTLSDFIK